MLPGIPPGIPPEIQYLLDEMRELKNGSREIHYLLDEVKALKARVDLLEKQLTSQASQVTQVLPAEPEKPKDNHSVFENYTSYYKAFGKSPKTFDKTMTYLQDKNSN
jgi:hypothetical protein